MVDLPADASQEARLAVVGRRTDIGRVQPLAVRIIERYRTRRSFPVILLAQVDCSAIHTDVHCANR